MHVAAEQSYINIPAATLLISMIIQSIVYFNISKMGVLVSTISFYLYAIPI